MTQEITTPGPGDRHLSTDTGRAGTRALLAGGVVAGPLYLVAALTQALTRDGFDITRHDVSLLSNGDLGWIQITNFMVTGLLVVASAVGMRRALRDAGPGRTWGPLLVGGYGVGLVAAGVFVADPALGFPPGTAADASDVSWHGALHFIAAAVGFLCLIAACFVFARRFARHGRRGWAAYSMATGIAFFAAFAGIAMGSGDSRAVLAFWVGVVVAWAWVSWISLVAARPAGRNARPAGT